MVNYNNYNSNKNEHGILNLFFGNRVFFLLLIFALVFIILIARLAWVQLVCGSKYSDEAYSSQVPETTIVAKRGSIYDRNGELLASSVDAKSVYANPQEITDATKTAEILYKYFGKEQQRKVDDYLELISQEDLSFVYIKRSYDEDKAEKLKKELESANLEGIHFLDDTNRVYPSDSVGSQVVGSVSYNSEDVLEGNSGLELQYEDLLCGTNGTKKVEYGANGIPIATDDNEITPAQDGEDIMISLDIRLQEYVEKRLKKAVKANDAEGGSVTIVDAKTGEIYAAASYTKQTDKKTKKVSYTQDVGKIWSFSDTYEPGSTFKAITACSVFANTSVTAKTKFSVPDSLKVYDHKINDSHEHDTVRMTFKQIIAESSNVGTVLAARKAKLSELYDTYKSFGFTKAPNTDFPGVTSGTVEESKDWDGVQAANVTFGQGLTVTGLQLVRAYGAIEQDGKMATPHFLIDLPHDSEKASELLEKYEKTQTVEDKKVCKKVTKLLRSVVTSGTGKSAAIDGYKVVGKTGTAEVADETGSYAKDQYNVSFAGWLEGSSSDLVCLVTVQKPGNGADGAAACGPVFADIMSFAIDRYQINP